MRRRPRWQDEGSEPDYRFSLANERTFLAWMRTALALLAGAAAVAFVPQFHAEHARWVLAIGLAVLGLAVAPLAYLRWAANERAMRSGRPLSSGYEVLSTSLAVTVIAIVVLVAAIVEAA